MTRYTGYRKTFNRAQHSARVEKPDAASAEDKSANRARIERMVMLRKKVCLKCRRRGHSLRDCPLSKAEGSGQALAVCCYKCGANDHTSKSCTIVGTSFKYATCFVCSQAGHLASQCTLNPNGMYPKGGGCRFCGSNKHLVKDCDQRAAKDAPEAAADFEEPVVDLQADSNANKKSVKKVKKIVAFK